MPVVQLTPTVVCHLDIYFSQQMHVHNTCEKRLSRCIVGLLRTFHDAVKCVG